MQHRPHDRRRRNAPARWHKPRPHATVGEEGRLHARAGYWNRLEGWLCRIQSGLREGKRLSPAEPARQQKLGR